MSDAEMDGTLFSCLLRHTFNMHLIGLAFDPDQDLEQKRSLRQDYRKLASKIEGDLSVTSVQVHLVLSTFVRVPRKSSSFGRR